MDHTFLIFSYDLNPRRLGGTYTNPTLFGEIVILAEELELVLETWSLFDHLPSTVKMLTPEPARMSGGITRNGGELDPEDCLDDGRRLVGGKFVHHKA